MKIVLVFRDVDDVVEAAMNEHHCDGMIAPEIEERLAKFVTDKVSIEFDLKNGTAKVLEA